MDIPSLFMIPSAVSSGKVHSVFPNSTDADFDFNRDSSATRVNSQGLIETVGYFSTEKLTGFTNGTTYAFTTFTTSGNNITSAIVSSAFAGAVSNAISVTSGQIYRVTFDYTKNSGNDLRVVFSSSANGAGTQISNNHLVSSSGSYSFDFTITSTTTGYLQMGTGNSGHSLNVSISNVSVKEIQGDRARLNYEIEGGLVNTKPSLLLEPQSTNLVTYSYNIQAGVDSGDFNKGSNAVLTYVSGIKAPDGTFGVYRLQLSAQSGTFLAFYTGNSKNTSLYVKAVDENNNNQFSLFKSSGSPDHIDFTATSDWKRYTLEYAQSGGMTGINNEGDTYASDVYIWGAQVEDANSYATSLIPTNGSTQTRAAESCNSAGTSSIFESSEGILYAEVQAFSETGSSGVFTLSGGSNTNRVKIELDGGVVKGRVDVSGSGVGLLNYTVAITNYLKIALKWKASDFELWVNGSSRASITSGSSFSANALTELAFDRGDGGEDFYGKIRDIRVYNTKEMTDSEVDILLTKITS